MNQFTHFYASYTNQIQVIFERQLTKVQIALKSLLKQHILHNFERSEKLKKFHGLLIGYFLLRPKFKCGLHWRAGYNRESLSILRVRKCIREQLK